MSSPTISPLIDDEAAAREPGARVVTVRRQELESLRVANDVNDLRPVDQDKTLLIQQDVLWREVTVGPTAHGEPGHGNPELLEEVEQQGRVRAGL